MNAVPVPTQLCGYCGAAFPAGQSCTCPQIQQARAARRAEIEARLTAQRLGVAGLDPTQKRPRSN